MNHNNSFTQNEIDFIESLKLRYEKLHVHLGEIPNSIKKISLNHIRIKFVFFSLQQIYKEYAIIDIEKINNYYKFKGYEETRYSNGVIDKNVLNEKQVTVTFNGEEDSELLYNTILKKFAKYFIG